MLTDVVICFLDRSIRPMFPRGFRNETQVRHNFTIDSSLRFQFLEYLQLVANLLSVDSENDPEVVAINAGNLKSDIFIEPTLSPFNIIFIQLLLLLLCQTFPGMDQSVRT